MLSYLNDRRSSVLVAAQVVYWCALATIVSSGHEIGAQREVLRYRYRPVVEGYRYGSSYGHGMRSQYGGRPMTAIVQTRPAEWSRLSRPVSDRKVEESEFGVPRNRSSRVKRHPHIYYEQYKVRNTPAGLLPFKLYPPAARSEPCSPPHFYRMLWNDGVDSIPEETGLWTGNAIVLKYALTREFLLTQRFDPRNLVREGQGQLEFLSTKFVNAGEERVRHTAPDEGDFNELIDSKSSFTPQEARIVFNFGVSQFQLYSHEGQDMKHLEVDEEPDLPKTNCLVYRYMPVYKPGGSIRKFVFKKTPVTVFQRPDLESIRMAQVEHIDDGFNWYHMGMPIICNDKLAYVLHSEPSKFTGAYRVRAVSVAFLITQMNKWASESIYKSMEDVPVYSMKAQHFRFG